MKPRRVQMAWFRFVAVVDHIRARARAEPQGAFLAGKGAQKDPSPHRAQPSALGGHRCGWGSHVDLARKRHLGALVVGRPSCWVGAGSDLNGAAHAPLRDTSARRARREMKTVQKICGTLRVEVWKKLTNGGRGGHGCFVVMGG